MTNNVIYILNGVHASGKSTVGKLLEQEGFNYLPEIASELMKDPAYEPGKDSDKEFQKEVFYREIRRDNHRNLNDNTIIETWHLGNLSHALVVADDELIRKEKEYLDRFIEEKDVKVKALYLDISFEEIFERSSIYTEEDKEVKDFYRMIEENLYNIYDNLEIDYKIIDNETNSPKETKQNIKEIIKNIPKTI